MVTHDLESGVRVYPRSHWLHIPVAWLKEVQNGGVIGPGITHWFPTLTRPEGQGTQLLLIKIKFWSHYWQFLPDESYLMQFGIGWGLTVLF